MKKGTPKDSFLVCGNGLNVLVADDHTLVADLAVALADVEEIHAIAVVGQVHIDNLAVGGNGFHQSTHYVVNLYALNAVDRLDADLTIGGVRIDFGR